MSEHDEKIVQLRSKHDEPPAQVALLHVELLRDHAAGYAATLHAFAELLTNGHTTSDSAPDPDSPALLALTLDGTVVGLIAYSVIEGDRALHVDVSWVHPHHRRKGLWSKMWLALIGPTLSMYHVDARRVYWVAHESNAPMRAALDKVGLKPAFVTYLAAWRS